MINSRIAESLATLYIYIYQHFYQKWNPTMLQQDYVYQNWWTVWRAIF